MALKIFWIVTAIILIAGVGYLYQTVPNQSDIKTVTMVDNSSATIGTIQLSETKAGVLFNVDLQWLDPNAEHAIHVHEKGDCSPLGSFKNAGGHYNPMNKMHGMKHPEGQHAGDMPNLKPDSEGAIKTTFVNMNITLDSGESSVFDEDGSAIVIHAGADDHVSQPSGAAGGRIACGIIQ